MYEEDKEKDEWVHQQVEEDGIVTLAQRYLEHTTTKRMIGFGYDIAKYFTRLADGRAEFTELRDDGYRLTHHQKMITPWILNNRSLYVTTYHKHSSDNFDAGTYTVFRSSQGNDKISEANYERTGDDVEADMILFWLQCMPVNDKLSRVRFVIKLNLGGSIPGRLRQVISSKQVGILGMINDMMKSNPAEFEESFNNA